MKTKQNQNRSRLNGQGRLAATTRSACDERTGVDRMPPSLNLKRILVPIDFSAESRRALEYAAAFASHFGASITLLHVVEPILREGDYGYGPVTNRVPNQESLKKAQTRLGTLRRRL